MTVADLKLDALAREVAPDELPRFRAAIAEADAIALERQVEEAAKRATAPDVTLKPVLTPEEIAELEQLDSPRSIYDACRRKGAGRLPSYKVGKRVRVTREAYLRWRKQREADRA